MTTKKKTTKPASTAKKKGKSVQFLQKPTCTTCRKARAYMENRGFDLHFRNLDKERLSSDELEKLIGDRDHTRISEHAQRALPPEKHEAKSADPRRSHSHDGRRAKSDPPARNRRRRSRRPRFRSGENRQLVAMPVKICASPRLTLSLNLYRPSAFWAGAVDFAFQFLRSTQTCPR